MESPKPNDSADEVYALSARNTWRILWTAWNYLEHSLPPILKPEMKKARPAKFEHSGEEGGA
jgi:hypothetical protein